MNFTQKRLATLCVALAIGTNATVFSQTPDSTSNSKPTIESTQGDGQITGKVADAAGKPIDFANVVLLNKAGGKAIRSTMTDARGSFMLKDVPSGAYTLKVSFVGYKPFSRENLNINQNSKSIALGTIKLSPSGPNVLNEVVVEGRRNNIQLGIDRKVFNVEQSIVSEGGSATDLLANIPSVSVDPDGNVSLRGTDNVRILIDGKPSAMAGSNIAQVLQSIPASSIQNIELITNPSSKYDPEGQSGIINIVLKKNQKIGLNGSVALSAGTQNNYNANTSLSYRDNRWNLFGNYGFRIGNRLGAGFNNTNFFLRDSSINNISESERKDLSNTLKAGVEFFADEKTTIGISAAMNTRDNDRNEDLSYKYFQDFSPSGTSLRTSRQDEKDNGYDLNFDFNRKFNRKGEELTANISYGKSKEDGLQELNQSFYTSSGSLSDFKNQRINDTYENGNNTNIQLDYTLPFNQKSKLEAGYRSTIRRNNENQLSDTLNLQTLRFDRDYNLTNDFHLEDMVHALYTNYQNELSKNFGFQIGLRAEQAYLNTDLTSTDTATLTPVSSIGRLDYFRIYPSIFLTQKLRGENQLQLSYTRRVNRPRGWQVNPFRDISDPNNIRQGNPNLRPEDIHAFEFSYLNYWKGFTLTSSVYFRQVNDVVQPLVDRIDNGATITRFYNLTRSQASGLELISRLELSKAINLTANLNWYYNKFSGSPENNIVSSDGFNWNGNLTSDIRLPNQLTGQIRMDYMAPRVMAQGRSREMYGLDIALRKDLFNRKASISLNVRNALNSRKFGGTTETSFFIRDFERQWQRRMANLTFSYRFGKQDMQQRNRRNNREREQQQQPDEEGMF